MAVPQVAEVHIMDLAGDEDILIPSKRHMGVERGKRVVLCMNRGGAHSERR